MKSIHVLICIGISLLILAILAGYKIIQIDDSMMIGYSISGFCLTISSIIYEITKISSFKSTFSYGFTLFLGMLFIIISPFIKDFFSISKDINLISNYCTIASISLILISLGVKEDIENNASKKILLKKHKGGFYILWILSIT